MKITDLAKTEYHNYYASYINLVNHDLALVEAFKSGEQDVISFFKTIPEAKLNYRYAEGKWSVKEVFQHLIDTERVFMYRCFRIARHDQTAIEGFEQDNYIKPSKADSKSLNELITEYQSVRQSFIVLLSSLTTEDLANMGNANGVPSSARACAFIILGHEKHHINVLNERYL